MDNCIMTRIIRNFEGLISIFSSSMLRGAAKQRGQPSVSRLAALCRETDLKPGGGKEGSWGYQQSLSRTVVGEMEVGGGGLHLTRRT